MDDNGSEDEETIAKPLECNRTVTTPLTTQVVGRDSDDRSAHIKLDPPAKFTGKGLPYVRDWVEETNN